MTFTQRSPFVAKAYAFLALVGDIRIRRLTLAAGGDNNF